MTRSDLEAAARLPGDNVIDNATLVKLIDLWNAVEDTLSVETPKEVLKALEALK
jgi:hypothetical protein